MRGMEDTLRLIRRSMFYAAIDGMDYTIYDLTPTEKGIWVRLRDGNVPPAVAGEFGMVGYILFRCKVPKELIHREFTITIGIDTDGFASVSTIDERLCFLTVGQNSNNTEKIGHKIKELVNELNHDRRCGRTYVDQTYQDLYESKLQKHYYMLNEDQKCEKELEELEEE